jgi:hypothetical protein
MSANGMLSDDRRASSFLMFAGKMRVADLGVRIAAGRVVIVCAPALQAFEHALNLGQLIVVEAALARATIPITLLRSRSACRATNGV